LDGPGGLGEYKKKKGGGGRKKKKRKGKRAFRRKARHAKKGAFFGFWYEKRKGQENRQRTSFFPKLDGNKSTRKGGKAGKVVGRTPETQGGNFWWETTGKAEKKTGKKHGPDWGGEGEEETALQHRDWVDLNSKNRKTICFLMAERTSHFAKTTPKEDGTNTGVEGNTNVG